MTEPKIRFKQDDGSSYPDWEEIKLCDIATRITRKNTNNETDRPLTIASIEGLVDQRSYFGKTIASKDMSGYYLLKKGEFAYNKSYSVGYDYGSIKRLDKYDLGALSTLYICFELKNNIYSDFYNCYFNGLSWYSQMAEICAEGARNHGLLNVSPNDFFNIKLSVPSSKEEQQKIADFLITVDEVISASEEEVANLETQKKAVMQKIFSQQVRFKKPDGTDFPDWEESTLEERTSNFRSGKFLESSRIHNNGLFPVIGGNGLRGYTDSFNHEGLFAVVGRQGALCGNLTLVDGKNYLTEHAVAVRGDDKTDTKFLYYLLGKMNLRQYSGQSAQPGLAVNKIIKLTALFPNIEEQKLIADFLSNFDEAITAAKKELELWKQLKKALLQQMFV